jgi:hypothetical protein
VVQKYHKFTGMQNFPFNKRKLSDFRKIMDKVCHLLQNDPAEIQKLLDNAGIS